MTRSLVPLSTPGAHTRPADSLREFATLYELVTAVVPTPPVFSEFLCAYGKVLKNAANGLDALAETLVARDSRLGTVAHGGAYSGGRSFESFLLGLRDVAESRTGKLPDLEDSVIAWLVENEELLTLAIPEPLPIPVRTFLGHEFKDVDGVVPADLLDWCLRNYLALGRLIWGQDKVCSRWGRGEECP